MSLNRHGVTNQHYKMDIGPRAGFLRSIDSWQQAEYINETLFFPKVPKNNRRESADNLYVVFIGSNGKRLSRFQKGMEPVIGIPKTIDVIFLYAKSLSRFDTAIAKLPLPLPMGRLIINGIGQAHGERVEAICPPATPSA